LAGPRAVLLCHGFRGYKDWGFIPLLASTIAAQGTPVAAFNMSGSGIAGPDGAFTERERFRKNTYAAELDDIHRVARWLRRRLDAGDPALGLIGHSRGGAMALLYGASRPEVRTVVSLAAPSRIGVWPEAAFEAWRDHRPHIVRDFRTRADLELGPEIYDDIVKCSAAYDLHRAAASLTIPFLVVQGDRDRSVPLEEGRTLASWGPRETTELAIIENAGHSFQAGDKIRRTPPQLLEMIERVSAWVRRTMEPDARKARP
jgi:pimeloyl-ACP methyl ester carboxylesterase